MVSLKQVLLHLWSDKSPYCEITNSIFAPSVVVLSLIYQFLDLLLNSPSTTIKCELDLTKASDVNSKLSETFSKPSIFWLGHQWRETNLHTLEPT